MPCAAVCGYCPQNKADARLATGGRCVVGSGSLLFGPGAPTERAGSIAVELASDFNARNAVPCTYAEI